MSEPESNAADANDAVPESRPTSSLGDWLRRAREQRGITIQQAASDLHLDGQIIEAIEGNHFGAMGAPVYAKGYLRRYARLLGLAEDEALSRYEVLGDTPKTVDPIPASHGVIPEPRRTLPGWLRWLIAGLVLLVGAAVAVNQFIKSNDFAFVNEPGGSVSVPVEATSTVPEAPATVQETPLQMASRGPEPATVQPAPASATGMTAQAKVVTPATTSNTSIGQAVVLQLRFTGDSWVEVYDANDSKLLYDMAGPAAPREVKGTAPLKVRLGSASVVKISINGRQREVPAGNVRSDVASFVVNAAGDIE